MVQKIIQSGNPILRKVSKPVGTIDKKVKALIQDLKDTLAVQKDPEGVGLAAPQIGVNLRVFAVDFKNLKRIIINPEVLEIKNKTKETKKKKSEILEGCLSLPGVFIAIKRPAAVVASFVTAENEPVIATLDGMEGRVWQHEYDHMEGRNFTMLASPLKMQLALKALRKARREAEKHASV